MTRDRVGEIYLEIQELGNIKLDVSPELGPRYLLDKLGEVRRQTDRLQTLTVEAHKALSLYKQAKRTLGAQRHLLRGQAEKSEQRVDVEQRLQDAENMVDEVQALERVLSVVRGNLKATDSDIRLASRLLDTQLRLGQVPSPPPRDTPVVPVAAVFAEERPAAPTTVVETTPALTTAAPLDEQFYKGMEGL